MAASQTLPDMGGMMKNVAQRLSTLEGAGYITATAASSTYLGINGKAKTATAADSATNDADGNKISTTYVKKSGDAGVMKGSETAQVQATAVTINDASAKTVHLTGAAAINVANGTSGKAWDASVLIDNASATIQLGSSWHWLGKVPTVKANSLLVLHWCDTFGIANLQTVS